MTPSWVKRFSRVPPIALLLFSLIIPSIAAAANWVGSWSSAQISIDPPNALPVSAQKDATLRQLVRVSIGGTRIRIRISNAFGTEALTVADADIALAQSPVSSRIVRSTDKQLTFSGERSVTIPAGAEYVSDPLLFNLPALSTLAISIHYADLPKAETGHPGSRATSYSAPGDAVAKSDFEGSTSFERWYFITGVDVEAPSPSSSIVALGDSITDGHGVPTNSNGRWTDVLAERLERSRTTRSLAVLNVGIGGNRVIDDGIGPSAIARMGRDVFARSGIKYLIVLEGVNDLGVLTRDRPARPDQHRQMVDRILIAYRQMIGRAHEQKIKVIGATIMPYAGSNYYHPDAQDEADRQMINAWIRARGHFDAVIDFDALMRDPIQPGRLRKDYDSGDGLHPSPAGYKAMGNAIPLSLFR